jgi:hypothetical protein
VSAVATIVRGVSGVRGAPAAVPEDIAAYPFAVTYASGGVWEFGPAGDKKGLHSVTVELHVARKELPRDVAKAMPFGDTIPNALMRDPTLGGTASTFGRIRYSFGPLGWGGMDTIGFRFVLEDIKVLSAIS